MPNSAVYHDDGGLAAEHSGFDSARIERIADQADPLSRWMGWRLRLLVVSALLGCAAVFALAHFVGSLPHINARWHVGPEGHLTLASATDSALQPLIGDTLISIAAAEEAPIQLDALVLRRSSRWLIHDAQRDRHRATQDELAAAIEGGPVTLHFASGAAATLHPMPLGMASLGVMFWLLCALALGIYLVAMVVLLAWPSQLNLLYALAALSQTANLVLLAIESLSALPVLPPGPALTTPLHAAFDLLAGAALVHACVLYPRRVPSGPLIAGLSWIGAALIAGLLTLEHLEHGWWWVQVAVATQGVLATAMLTRSHRLEPNPAAIVMRRFASLALVAWCLLTVAIWGSDGLALQEQISLAGPPLWSVFLGMLLAVLPMLGTSQGVMREFSLLAAVTTTVTALDLMFVAVFSLGQLASLTLALFLSLGLYSAARQWVLNRLHHHNVISTERMFDQMYRMAREVEAHPERTDQLLTQLLQGLFRPLRVDPVERRHGRVRIANNGSTLLVPIPEMHPAAPHATGSLALHYAHHGRRVFTSDDARLATRVLQHLQSAVAFDRAVEQGRNEERQRIAQDLHDDIGARLLTLMYKAPSPEVEDYVRHTLQDLKTLTRGLAAPIRPISHAAAEWKADLTHRLNAAHISLGWSVSTDRDVVLTVVQWSALTRVLRELVTNVISHSQARHVDIDLQLDGERLELSVSDNGVGRSPHAWAHGLGLGGVRKRVKQLGGDVAWHELPDGGIRCDVSVAQLSAKA